MRLRLAGVLLGGVVLGGCGGDDPFPALPGTYELVTAEGDAPPLLLSDEGGIRMYLDSMYVEFREDTTQGTDGIYTGRWRVEHRLSTNDSTYFVAYAEGEGTWDYTSDRDVVLYYANGGLRTRGTRERSALELRQFFALEIEGWVFERTSNGPDLID